MENCSPKDDKIKTKGNQDFNMNVMRSRSERNNPQIEGERTITEQSQIRAVEQLHRQVAARPRLRYNEKERHAISEEET